MTDLTGWAGAIRGLLGDMAGSNVTEIEIESGETRLKIVRRAGALTLATAPIVYTATAGPTINAPLAGIFYRASAPTVDPYAREGDEIEVGQTIALIEAMKVFNEIHADRAGRIRRFLADNGDLVQTGDPLVELEPAE